jgi:photosystem II stability/assembly factor-like uncharacterized protein
VLPSGPAQEEVGENGGETWVDVYQAFLINRGGSGPSERSRTSMVLPNPGLRWRPTSAPASSSRTDDIWFVDPNVGWAVNSNGQILKTSDGGESWQQQLQAPVYLRCIGFADGNVGWAGTLTPTRRLFATRDGGATWSDVANLPPVPRRICGLSVVGPNVVFVSGTNYPTETAAVVKTTDGGETWSLIDLSDQAALLVDIHFATPERGWVVGGRDAVRCTGQPTSRDVVRPVVLYTEDGGDSWTDLIADWTDHETPHGEWGWKIFFVNDQLGYISLENFHDGALLKSTDSGRSWTRLRINDRQRNSNLEGVGFIDETTGWVGGWGDWQFVGGFTSQTTDGGETWDNAKEVGFRLNRFRFFGTPVTVGYASGDTVYKYSAQSRVALAPLGLAGPEILDAIGPMTCERTAAIDVSVPDGARSLVIDIWERFGDHVRELTETDPMPGRRTVTWDFKDQSGRDRGAGSYILRVTIDGKAASRIISRPR